MTRTITAAALYVGLLAVPQMVGSCRNPFNDVAWPQDAVDRQNINRLSRSRVRCGWGAHMERGPSGHCHGQRQCGSYSLVAGIRY
jgi:hypothetical protein